MTKYRYMAPCHFGLEKTLSFEVKRIGGEDVTVSDGRVMFSGDAALCARANICLSTAERVGIVLGQFKIKDSDGLFYGVQRLPLKEFIGKYDQFPVVGHTISSVLKSESRTQATIKKAMALNLCRAYGLNTMPETGAKCQIRFLIQKDEATITLDTSGDGLHKRGYRRTSNAAPIKETLAAGIIDIARVRDGDVICDPFCGSGTLLIEAAMKALNIAPGLKRSFLAETYGFLPQEIWREARHEAAEQVKHGTGFHVYGYDIDSECVELTLANAKKAGVDAVVKAARRDIAAFEYPERPLKIITNPPYGERMLEVTDAREIYRAMGERLLPLDDSQLYIITPDEEFEDTFGLKADKNRKLYNGMMMCRLYSYFKKT